MKLKLDAKTVSALALGQDQNEAFAWDAELAGFGLRLQGRRRTYVAQYRANGRTRRFTLGTAERLTPAQAREGARKILARAALGEDPQAKKSAQRVQAERTFAKVADVYLAAKQSGLRPVSYRIAKLYLTGPYFRPLHAMGINEITHPDVAARLSAIARAHSAHTAAAARRAISALFKWLMEEGLAQANPVVGTRKPADPKPRDRVLTDAELVAIWNACGDDDFGRIVRLLILTGARRGEIGGMRWSEFDLTAGTWTLPCRAQQEPPRQRDRVAAGGAKDRPRSVRLALQITDRPTAATWRSRSPIRSSGGLRLQRLGKRPGGARPSSRRRGEALAAALHPPDGRHPHGRYRHRTACDRGRPQSLFRPPRRSRRRL